ncbi:MAG: MFS transporter [Candidatus Heimdallarchaeota archaeon]|nr:MFS transporter [Candidatus Heimdallarchaeota archaeon]
MDLQSTNERIIEKQSNFLESENRYNVISKKFIKNCFAIGFFSFSYNFLTTAEYVNFREILGVIGFTSATKISILLASALFALCFGAIFGGFINDKIRSRFGQRIPSIFLGTFIASCLILSIPIFTMYITNLTIIFYCLLVVFIISHLFLGAAYTPWLALVADLFKQKERTIIGIGINIFSAGGAAIATILFSLLIDERLSWVIWIITGIMLMFASIITSLLLPRKNPIHNVRTKFTEVFRIPRIIWKFGGITWSLILIVNALWSFSSHLVETGLVDSLVSRFPVTETQASLASNILMGGYIIIFLFPTIWIINKFGKIKASIFTSIFYAIFCFLIAIMQNFSSMYYIALIGGISNIFLSTIQIALPADLVPKGREASFMGIFFVFSTAMKPFATLIQGFLLENNESQLSLNNFSGYPGTFMLASLICITTLVLLFIVNSKQEKPLSFNSAPSELKKDKEKGIEMKTSQLNN